MNKYIIKISLFCAAVAASNISRADDADVDVVGPNGRSSIAASIGYYKNQSDLIYRLSGEKAGYAQRTVDNFTTSGIYALNNKLSFTGSVQYTFHDQNTFNWLGTTQTTEKTGNGGSLGLAALLFGDQIENGFALAGNAGIAKSEGSGAVYFAALQPQYRFSSTLLMSLNIGLRNQNSNTHSTYAALNIVWRVAPKLSLVPSFAVSRFGAYDSYNSFQERTAALSATYHLSNDWSASASGSSNSFTDRRTFQYSNNFTNASLSTYSLNVRRSF